METTGDKEQVQIRFITRQKQFAVPDYPLSVPSESPVSELNVLVNELLKESDEQRKTIEFDFLVNSEFLRSSLKEHIAEKDISVENVIDVEYIEKHPPPEPQDCLIHDDWVSAVAMQDKWILSGCYDNTLHIWTAKGAHHLNIPVYHTAAIKSVAWISMDNESATFVSASQDQTAIIWKWDIANNSVEIVCVCKGHERGLERVGVNARNNLMATGAWDTMLKIWSSSLKNEQENGEPPSKRSKADPSKTRMPIRTIKAHREAVSGVVWSDKAELITASWDHSIKIWDAELGGMKHEIPGNKSFFDIDYSPLNRMIIAGSADRHVRLFDPRSTDTVVKTQFTSHNSWVSAVSWSTTDEHLFLSGAYDNEVKLWDTRSPKAPLFDLSGHEDKVLCCNWSNPKYLISGGSDNTVRIFKSKHAVH